MPSKSHRVGVGRLLAILLAGLGFVGLAQSHEDQISIVVAQFDGPESIGLGVANVLKLKLQTRAHTGEDTADHKSFGDGYYQVSRLPIQPAGHQSAERRAKVNSSQITLWGSIASVGEMVLMKTYITVPSPYKDFRLTSNEIWTERLNGHELSVTLPRRRIDFSLQALPKEVMEYYASDLAEMKICRTPEMKNCPDRVGEGVRFKEMKGDDLVYVRYPVDRHGYVRLPKIVSSAHPDVVDYASGLMKIYRGDWARERNCIFPGLRKARMRKVKSAPMRCCFEPWPCRSLAWMVKHLRERPSS